MNKYVMYTLRIKCESPELRAVYADAAHTHEGDSGIDLYLPTATAFSHFCVTMVSHKIQCQMLTPTGMPTSYWLVPRSSIAKTPLMLANSVGLIDAGYRGDIIGAFRSTTDCTIEPLTRLLQICAPTLGPIRVELVDELPESSRGSGGFGSTGGVAGTGETA